MHLRTHHIIFLKQHFDLNIIQVQKNIDHFNDESAVMGSSVVVWDNLPKTLYVRKHISLNASNRHSQKILVIYLFFHNKIISQSIFDELLFLITNLEGFIAVSIWLLRFALLFIVFWLIFVRMIKTYCEQNKQILFSTHGYWILA